MVRFYKRKSNHVSNDRQKIFAAVRDVRIHKKSLRKTAKKFGLQFGSLRYHLVKYANVDVEDDNALLAYQNNKQVFTPAMENELLTEILGGNQVKKALSTREIGRAAYNYAKSHNVAVPKNWVRSKMAGKDWVLLFKKRHKLPRRRIKAQVETKTDKSLKLESKMFFENLVKILSSYDDLKPEDIFNLMEIKIATSNEPNRIAMQKILSEENLTNLVGKLVTMAATTSASGVSLPPFFIFPKNHQCEDDFQVVSEGSESGLESGEWTNKEYFLDYLQHFVCSTGCSIQKPRLLILDYHECHERSKIEEYTNSNGIVLLPIKSKYSHKLQPFEVSLLPSFKKAFNKIAREWVSGNPNQTMSVYDVPKLVAEIYVEVFCKENIQTGFQERGIYPLNSDIIKDVSDLEELNSSTIIRMQQSNEENLQVSLSSSSDCLSENPKRVVKRKAHCSSFCSREKLRKENTEENKNKDSMSKVDEISYRGRRVILNKSINKQKIDVDNQTKIKLAPNEELNAREICSTGDQIKEALASKIDISKLIKFRKIMPKPVEPKKLCTESISIQENIQSGNLISTKERLLMKILEKMDKKKTSTQQNNKLSNGLKKNRCVLRTHTLNISDSHSSKNSVSTTTKKLLEKIVLTKENENLKKTEESNKCNLERENVEDIFESREPDIYDLNFPCDEMKDYSVESLDFVEPHELHTSTAEFLKENNYGLNISSEPSVIVEYIPYHGQKENSTDNLNTKQVIFSETPTFNKNSESETESLEEKKLIIREIIQSIASKRK